MASTYLTRTFDQVGNRQTWTLSVWIKRTGIGGQQNFFGSFPQSTDYERIMFNNDKIYMSEVGGGSTSWEVETDAVYRDPNAWYHLVLRHDTTQATANDRIRLYMNGVQQTFATNTQPDQNRGTAINTADVHKIGMGYTSEYTDCVMSHFHWCDGQSYAPTEFGSTDSTTGEWKINTSPSVSYGTNGFFILKDGTSVTDQGGGSHNWTVAGGTLSKTEDNPSNVFATLNPLLGPRYSTQTFSNGNTTVAAGGGGHEMHMSTLAIPNSGKYYYEAKLDAIGNFPIIGVVEAKNVITNNKDINTYGYGYFFNGNIVKLGGSPISPTYSSYTTGDFIGVAVDCDNKEIYFSKNGTWQNSSDPANRTNPAITGLLTDDLMLGVNNYGGTWSVNFGNGAFGSTQLTGTTYQANGNLGIFKYPVPTGFRALCTNSLNL